YKLVKQACYLHFHWVLRGVFLSESLSNGLQQDLARRRACCSMAEAFLSASNKQ
ncbi:hypothetical protein KI387_019022, partial [Taxus chinensis]